MPQVQALGLTINYEEQGEGEAFDERLFQQILETGRVPTHKKKECGEIASALAMTSLCGLGTGLADFAQSALRHYAKELESCFS